MLLHMARSGGYLPLDGHLWLLARAQTSQFFQKEAGPVLACFESRQIDGRVEIYSDRLLEALSDSTASNQKPRARIARKVRDRCINIRFIESKELQNLFEEGYKSYPRHVAKLAAEKAYLKAVTHVVKLTGVTYEQAAGAINEAIRIFARSPAGSRPDKQYINHMSSWLNQGHYLNDLEEWQQHDRQDSRPSGATVGLYRPCKDCGQDITACVCGQGLSDN